ncbi:hypothetical protein Hanom_Chr08g00694931 [Helianthus anomalus]
MDRMNVETICLDTGNSYRTYIYICVKLAVNLGSKNCHRQFEIPAYDLNPHLSHNIPNISYQLLHKHINIIIIIKFNYPSLTQLMFEFFHLSFSVLQCLPIFTYQL